MTNQRDVQLEELGLERLKVELGVLLELVHERHVPSQGDVALHISLRKNSHVLHRLRRLVPGRRQAWERENFGTYY